MPGHKVSLLISEYSFFFFSFSLHSTQLNDQKTSFIYWIRFVYHSVFQLNFVINCTFLSYKAPSRLMAQCFPLINWNIFTLFSSLSIITAIILHLAALRLAKNERHSRHLRYLRNYGSILSGWKMIQTHATLTIFFPSHRMWYEFWSSLSLGLEIKHDMKTGKSLLKPAVLLTKLLITIRCDRG